MEATITIDGVEYTLVPVTSESSNGPPPLNIQRPYVVYAADGTRVDGYRYESRALRNNKARFAGTGFWLGKADSAEFVWVDA